MSLLELLQTGPSAEGAGRIYGVVTGVVTNNEDPEKLGRVKVRFPWLSDSDESWWARIAAPMAGKEMGTYFLPEVDDEVLVAFERGDPRFPYVLGALWSGAAPPPETNEGGTNDHRTIRSRSGHLVRLSDKDGEEKIEIVDKSGKNSIVVDTAENTVTITADADITLRSASGKLVLEGNGVEVKSGAGVTIEAKQSLEVRSDAQVTVEGATINLN